MKKSIFLILPIALLAQINEIKYKGLIHISPLSANAIINIQKGSEFDIKKIDKALKKLYKTGYFQTIKVDYSNGILTFICKEKPTIAKIKFYNVPEDVKNLLKEQKLIIKKGEILQEEKIKKIQKFIEEYYKAKGYFNSYVKVIIKPLPNNRAEVEIIAHKGRSVYVREVNFFGATLPKDELLDEVENQPRTFWSNLPFTNSGKLNLLTLLNDKIALKNYYMNLGYIDANISTPFASINTDSYFADIDYKIEEGKRYIVKKVSIDYPKTIKVKLPKLNLKPNKYFNISALKKDIKNIQHAFMDKGYAYAKVYPDIKKENNFAHITYKVIPGEIVYINDVIIEGNNKTLDRVVRRNIFLAPGDKFSYTDFQDSINALKRKGYYKEVSIKKERISQNKMNLKVKAVDGLSGMLKAGISYGTYTKLGFNFSLSEKNIFGSGQTISINADVSSVSSSYSISLFNPRISDSLYSFNFSLYKRSFDGISYTSKQKGGSIGIGRQLNRFTSANITYGYVKTKLTDYPDEDYIKPNSTKSYVTLSLAYNNTDDYFFPTNGIIASASSQIAGLGGDEKFIKTLLKAKTFYPITDKTYNTIAVLKYRVIAGAIKDNGYLPINEKFYVGGARSIRGFNWYSISPVDKKGNKIGGKYEFITGPEISTPLSEKSKIWLTGFIDYGAVGEDRLNITRSSYGFEIDWITPMGPLSFIWAWPIKSESGDDLQKFEFNIGATF